jgi:hypothetical protein
MMRTEKPTLRITRWLRSSRQPIPFEAECSSCPNAQFKIPYDKRSYRTPDRDGHFDILQRKFEEHLRSEHANEVASRALRARIRFLTPSEGGKNILPRDGYHPQLKLGDFYTSCYVRRVDGQDDDWFELGKDYEVRLELLFPKDHAGLVPDTGECELYEDNHLVARGWFSNGQRV